MNYFTIPIWGTASSKLNLKNIRLFLRSVDYNLVRLLRTDLVERNLYFFRADDIIVRYVNFYFDFFIVRSVNFYHFINYIFLNKINEEIFNEIIRCGKISGINYASIFSSESYNEAKNLAMIQDIIQ